MKKLLLSAALLCGLASTSQAGQLQGVSLSGAPLITVYGGYEQTSPLQATVVITNNSGRSMRLGLQRQILQEVAGSENNFCFGPNCYPPNVTTSPSPITVLNGGIDNSMVLDYTPHNRAGITIIRYAVYETGTTDSTYVTVRYDASQRVLGTAASRASESVLSQPWPNPLAAGSTLRFSYQLPAGSAQARFDIISLADGRRVSSAHLTASSVEALGGVSTQGLAPGYYAVLLLGNEGRLLAARRFLVE